MTPAECTAARFRLLEFIRAARISQEPFVVGRHTLAITSRLDRALYDYQHGKSTYLIITVPFRHGKSEIVSRHFPPFAFGMCPDAEMILATYSDSLSRALSRDARSVIKSESYAKIFPDVRLSRESASVQTWGIAGHVGKFQTATIAAGGTGKGADFLLIDDYLRGRSVAESQLERDKQWENFSGNLMTRLAPVHMVVILATPWHPDDLIGRIKNRMNPEHKDYSPDFPHFEILRFPARADDGSYLFPERFSSSWYEKQFAVLGPYQAASLLQCDPVVRGGNMLQIENVKIIDAMPAGLRWVRFWDLASGKKERVKDDPDSTAGAKVAVTCRNGIYTLYIDDVRFCQAEALERNQLIADTAIADGPAVQVGVESVAGYKDTWSILSHILQGKRIVRKITVSADKVIRAGEVEPVFAAGNVYMRRAWWNQQVLAQLGEFPAGAHDDIVDAITGGYAQAIKACGCGTFIQAN